MKVWNLKQKKITQSWGDGWFVVVGENGRARREVLTIANIEQTEKTASLGVSRKGLYKIIRGAESPRWLCVLSGAGCYTRGTFGTVYVPKSQKQNVQIAAHGFGAYGAAGRVGEWHEWLAVVEDGTWVYVRPAGGPRKMDRYFLYFGDKNVHKVFYEELDAYMEQGGAVIPPEVEAFEEDPDDHPGIWTDETCSMWESLTKMDIAKGLEYLN